MSSRLSRRDWAWRWICCRKRAEHGTGRGDFVDYAQPVLFALLEKYLAKTETLEEQTLEEAIEEEKQIPVDICNHALLVGYGRVGSLLGRSCSPLIFRWW